MAHIGDINYLNFRDVEEVLLATNENKRELLWERADNYKKNDAECCDRMKEKIINVCAQCIVFHPFHAVSCQSLFRLREVVISRNNLFQVQNNISPRYQQCILDAHCSCNLRKEKK